MTTGSATDGEERVREIGFAEELIPLIEAGVKTRTYRTQDSRAGSLRPGDSARIRGTELAVRITGRDAVPFGELPLNAPGHEPYGSREQMRVVFQGYYGRDIPDDETMIVLRFTLEEDVTVRPVTYEVTALPEDFSAWERRLWTLHVEYKRDKGWGVCFGGEWLDADGEWDSISRARWHGTWEEAIAVAVEEARTLKIWTAFGALTAREAAARERKRNES